MIIAFHDNALSERGTTIAIYDYAYYNQTLLGNKSIILYEKNNINNNQEVIQKFQKEFNIYGYESWSEVDEVLKNNQVSILYLIKYGFNDNKLSKICKNVVHCVFDCGYPHGNIYSSISPWVKNNNNKYPIVPHMINLPELKENIRIQLNIPKEAIVFGRYGGYEQFDIQYVKETIIEIANENPHYYFVFVNTRPFSNNIKNILYLDKIIDLEEKVKFINSCDAMIWGRSDGETFGSAIAEFSTQNKPVIACKYYNNLVNGVFDVSHVHLLGNKALWYKDKESLKKIFYEFQKEEYLKKDWNAYKDYTPNKVMKKFKEIYIDNKNEDLVIDKIDNFIISHYKNDTLCEKLKYGKYWEPHLWKFIEILYNNYHIENIIDIGANIGYHSLFFSKHVKNKVYAFEPHPQVFNVLKNNIKLNNIENINIINKCVGDKVETVFMSKLNFLNESNHGDIHILNNKSDYQIESIKLDDYKFSDIDLIKIDVQGYELMVLNGSIQTILNNKPIIIIEIEQHQLHLTHTKSQEIINFFNNNEYEVYLLNYSYLSDYICIHKNNIEFKDIFKNFIKENSTNNKFISGDINIKYMIDLKYDIYQDYIFIKGKDQSGQDLYLKENNIEDNLFIALKDNNCVAINSKGYFKSSVIHLDKSNFLGENGGIYIKKKYYQENLNNNLMIDKNRKLYNSVFNFNLKNIEKNIKKYFNDYELFFLWGNEQIIKNINNIDNQYIEPSKKYILFMHHDYEHELNTPNNVLLIRSSLLKSKQKKNEIVYPVFWINKMNFNHYFLNPIHSNLKPSISFCGYIHSYSKRLQWCDYLKQSSFIDCHFIYREQFMHANYKEYIQNMNQCEFCFCPRGTGNFSIRFYECLYFGRIPVLIDTDILMHYEDEIDWSNHIVFSKNIEDVPHDIVSFWNSKNIIEVQENNKRLYQTHFSEKNILKYFNKSIEKYFKIIDK